MEVLNPQKIKNLANLLSRTQKRVQANYAFWRFTQDVVRNNRMVPLKDKCWKKLLKNLPVAMNIFYVKKYFDIRTMKQAVQMIENIKFSFAQLIKSVSRVIF